MSLNIFSYEYGRYEINEMFIVHTKIKIIHIFTVGEGYRINKYTGITTWRTMAACSYNWLTQIIWPYPYNNPHIIL